jgi:mono/diheme cytochrome c family protein
MAMKSMMFAVARRACAPILLLASALCTLGADTNGFAVKFTSADGKTSDTMVLLNLWLYVEDGKPAAPFASPGKFTATFEGVIIGELRANYFFKAEELSGSLKLEINNSVVLDTSAPGALSKSVQINKGPNAVKATFTAAPKGDSFLRMGWTEKGTNVNPIPNSWIAHASTPEVQKAATLHLGRELFLEYRCAKCHTEKFSSPVPDLAMDAPAFSGIGARRNYDWLANWILDPKSTRASVHMPRLLHGAKAKEDAGAIAAYLSSLTADTTKPSSSVAATPQSAKAIAEIAKRSGVNAKATAGDGTDQPADSNQERKPIFERLHCVSCHNAPDQSDTDPAKISLKHVAAKFREGKLAEFLIAPEQHFEWIRMPSFKLAPAEAKELATFLLKHAEPVETKPAPSDKGLIERGKQLVQSAGCINCHAATGLENKYAALSLAKVAKEAKGCLADKRDDSSKAPDFGFAAGEREALLAFVKTDFSSLSRHAPLEFAARETRLLNCAACHGQIELIPGFDVLGGKLKPEWAASFLAGEPFKVRADLHPKGELWVEARMPAFRSRAKLLAEAMAMQQGYPPKTPAEGPIDVEAAKIGHKMIGKDNGLSCISCHAVNDLPALEVFESEGINLGLTSGRLLKPYFFRWMRSPLSVEPTTKMPAYFEDGRSALTDYYEGDAEKQIHALYEYMRQAEKMAAPARGL